MEIPGIGSTMNTFRTFLADMNIASKFLIRIGVTLGVASIVAVWFIARVQNEQSESDFRERMTNLAVTLPISIHSVAEENASKLGFEYHRASVNSIDERTAIGKLEKEAVEQFKNDPTLASWEKKIDDNGTPRLIVFVPGRGAG
jgi:hypothetical protein